MAEKKSKVSKVFMGPGWQEQWRDQLNRVTYMENFATLLLVRAMRLGKEMKICTGMEEAGKFGDVVMQIDENGIKHHQLLHFSNGREEITTYALTSTEKNAPFGLIGYFNSFRKMKNKFIGNGNEVSDLVICNKGKIKWPVKQSLFGISLSIQDSFYGKRDGIFFTKDGNMLGSTLIRLRNDRNNRILWARLLRENAEMKDDDLEQDIEIFLDKIRLSKRLPKVKGIRTRTFQELHLLGIETLHLCDAYSFMLEKVLQWRKREQKYRFSTVDGIAAIGEFKKKTEWIEFGVEKPVKYFSGRSAELQQIISECKTSNKLEMIITGIRGIGKTELAKKFAAEWKCAFHCILWMKGETMEDLINSFKELAFQKLSVAENEKDGKEKDFKKILQEINENLNGRRCLLILDNVFPMGEDSDRSYLKKFLSLLAFKPFLLMTSRHEPCGGVSVLPLKNFKSEEAVEMVKDSLGCWNYHDDSIKSFTKQLNNYPPALRLAIAYISENPKSISSYSETLDKILNNLSMYNGRIPVNDEYMITMMAALEVIREKLRENEDELAEKCLQIISFMNPDEIYVHKVACCFEKEAKERLNICLRTLHGYEVIQWNGVKVNINEVLQILVRCRMQEEDEIEALEKILKAESTMNMSYEMLTWEYVCKHEDLVRKYSCVPALILKNLNEEEKYEEGYEFGKKNVKILSKHLHETDKDLLDAIKQLADIAYHYEEESEALELYQDVFRKLKKSQGEESIETMSIRKKVASLLLEMEKYDESLSTFQEMLTCLEKTLPKSDHKVLRTRCFMALTLAKLGRNEESASTLHDIYTCIKVIEEDIELLNIKKQVAKIFLDLRNYEESLTIYKDTYAGFKKLLGAKHLDSLSTQRNIAMILEKLGENRESLEIYQTINAMMKETIGHKHPDTVSTAQSIVSLLNELGRYKESLNISKTLNKTSVRVLGGKNPVTLKIGQAIGLSLRKLGKLEESLAKFKEIYPAMKQVFGEDNPFTVNTGQNIASLLFEMKNIKDSHAFYSKIYPVLKKSLGEMHSDVLYSGLNYAITFIELGKYKEGHELCKDLYQHCKKILGVEHPDTLRSGCRIALTLEKLGRSKESLVVWEEQYDCMKKVFGDNHLETLNARCCIASALNSLGKYEESFKVYEEVYISKKNLFGDEHLETFSLECKMAACMYEMGKNNESLSMYRELVSRMQKVLGEKHTDVLNVKCRIAFTMRELGKYERSLEVYKEVYNDVKTLLGEEDPRTLGVKSDIALTEEKLSKCRFKSLPTHMEIYGIMKKVLGKDHPSTINAHGYVAATLVNLGKRKGGLEILHEMKERLGKILGEEHPETLRVMSKIADTLGKMKKYDESLAMFEEVCCLMTQVLGDEHKITLKTRSEMSCVLRNSGRYEESLALSLEIYQIMMKVLGKEHPETLNIMNDIGATFSKLERFEESLNIYNEVYQGMKAVFGEENIETINTKKNVDLMLQKVKKS